MTTPAETIDAIIVNRASTYAIDAVWTRIQRSAERAGQDLATYIEANKRPIAEMFARVTAGAISATYDRLGLEPIL